MKRLSLTFKYSLFFFPFLIVTGILLYFLYPDPIVTVITCGLLLISYIVSIAFIRLEVIKPLRDTAVIADEISHPRIEEFHDEDFSVKIAELKRISDKLEEIIGRKYTAKEIQEVYNSMFSVNNRLITELDTAKIFKVNRNEFFGNVAHELRTPIFAIQLSLETLIDGAIHDKSVNIDFLQRAKKQSERLKDLVSDLMTISKYESGVKLSKRYFSLSEHIQGVIGELKGIAENRHIVINYVNELRNGVQVFGDSDSIKQVFINLVENSIKYTPENGHIVISTTDGGKDVNVTIEDDGIGIPEKDLPRIFERFYRVDKNRSRDRGGTGLGLSIVKHILEVHDSKINVESEVGKGTKFNFTLKK